MGEYVDVGPVHMWFETRGQGENLVLMHGGLDTNASWAAQMDPLSKHFRVFAPERRGHGHTPDVEGALSFRVMTEDAVAFIERVVGTPVHLVGWSDGAIVGLLVALDRPDLVRKLVLIGCNVEQEALVPQARDIADEPADSPMYQPLRAVYEAVSPDGPDHWPALYEKLTSMWRREPHIPLEDLARVRSRSLVMVGDDDLVKLEHSIAMYRAIPDAELAVVPGTSHVAPMEKPDLVNHILTDFLRFDAPPTLLPIRRASAAAPA
ncbi:MAG TPA: alpha/beta hydrolase [Nocardioidaceae bacterium]|nr:alpha/beta hydrolase [Nocardioidaceae bacterium]